MADELELDPELQSFIEERLGHPFEASVDPEPDLDEGEDDSEDEGGGDESATHEAPEASPPSNILEVAPGVALTREQALSYYEFDALLKGRPELRDQISDLVNRRTTGEAVVPEPAPVSLDIPEEYRDDPAFQAVHTAYSAQQTRLAEIQEKLDQISNMTVERDREEMSSLIDQARVRFQQEHSLSNEEMQRVASTAGYLDVLPKLLSGIDPQTGQPAPRDRAQALDRAFEIAYWWLPETREKALQAQVTSRAKSTQRKQRLAGVSGGGGGSVPQNTDPRKMTSQERREAMIREVAGFGGQED